MKWTQAKQHLLKDETTRKAYENTDLSFEIGKMITDARIMTKMTQETLAEKLGTKQPSIARLESGNTLPSLSFLNRLAIALGTKLLAPRFEILTEEKIVVVRQYYYATSFPMNTPLNMTTHNNQTRTATVQDYNSPKGGNLYGQYITA